jgi:hypothetical protein
MAVSLVSTGVTFPDSSTQITAATGFGFKNRIINGAMVIDQRNAGASITGNDGVFPLDRFTILATQTSKLTVQQSTTAPTGFGFSLLATSSSAYSVTSSDQFTIQQRIEGFNSADLSFGSASASTITLSFWVRSSLTGTFGGALTNSAYNRSYPFSYTISAANTWEQKTVTIAGDTTGTWIGATNGVGLRVSWSLGAGSAQIGTAGAWSASAVLGVTGQTNLVGTNGATFYITGVQLEKGSTATSFDYRPYSAELALCQRYCVNYRSADSGSAFLRYGVGQCDTTTNSDIVFTYPVPMRVTPTVTTTGTASNYGVYSGGAITACSSVPTINASSSYLKATINATVASGLTVGRACALLSNNNNTSYLLFSAEL